MLILFICLLLFLTLAILCAIHHGIQACHFFPKDWKQSLTTFGTESNEQDLTMKVYFLTDDFSFRDAQVRYIYRPTSLQILLRSILK